LFRFLYLLFFLLTACNAFERDPAVEAIDDYGTALLGEWKTECLLVDGGESIKHVKTFGTSYFINIEGYADEDCVNISSTGIGKHVAFNLGDKLVTDEGLEANEIDYENPSGDHFSPKIIFDIVYIAGDKLYFGKAKEDISRPSSIELSTAYYRVE